MQNPGFMWTLFLPSPSHWREGWDKGTHSPPSCLSCPCSLLWGTWRTCGSGVSWWDSGLIKRTAYSSYYLLMILLCSCIQDSQREFNKLWVLLRCLRKLWALVSTLVSWWLSLWPIQFLMNGVSWQDAKSYKHTRPQSTWVAWLGFRSSQLRRLSSYSGRSGNDRVIGLT